jgi:sphingomyelin phosphodiesterase 2
LLTGPRDRFGKRLDYIFAGSGDIQVLGGGWVVKRVSVGMMMRHPELGCSLSDHFSMEATLVFHPLQTRQQSQPLTESKPHRSSNTKANPTAKTSSPTAEKATGATPSTLPTNGNITTPLTDGDGKEKAHSLSLSDDPEQEDAFHNGTYLQIRQSPTPSVVRNAESYDTQLLSFLNDDRPTTTTTTDDPQLLLSSSAYDDMLAVAHAYASRERSQRKWRALHFFASLLVTLACLVGVWFSPANYVSFILVLVSSLSLTAGTIDGLLALLFFKSELRALKEFEWEVRNAKAMTLGRVGRSGVGLMGGAGEAVGRVGGVDDDGGLEDDRGW